MLVELNTSLDEKISIRNGMIDIKRQRFGYASVLPMIQFAADVQEFVITSIVLLIENSAKKIFISI